MKKLGFGTMRLPLLDPKNPKSIYIRETLKTFHEVYIKQEDAQ